MKKLLLPALLLVCFHIQAQKRILIDTHNDALSAQLLSGADLGHRQKSGNFDLVRAAKGGLNAQVFSVWCGEDFDKAGGFAHANREIDSLYSLIARNPGKIVLVHNSAELKKAVGQHRLAAMIGVEGGHMIENRIDYIDSLAKRGMLYLTLTWNNSTPWATSARDEVLKRDSLDHIGLTEKGKQIVRHLNKTGVMVDVSHAGEATFNDVLATTTKPVIASHSCAYTLAPHRRNLKDGQLQSLAKNGGVVFVNFYSGFIDSAYEKRQMQFLHAHKTELDSLRRMYGRDYSADRLNALYPREAAKLRPPISMLIRHIDYMVKLIGAEHVGIGSDFDGSESYPKGLNSVKDYPKVVRALKRLGYSEQTIALIFGGNFIRVMEANAVK